MFAGEEIGPWKRQGHRWHLYKAALMYLLSLLLLFTSIKLCLYHHQRWTYHGVKEAFTP